MYAKDTTNNTTRQLTCTPTGELIVSVSGGISGGGGGSGTSNTTEATQILVKEAVQSLDANLGEQDSAAATSDTGTFPVIAFLKRQAQNFTTLLGRLPSLSSGRIPVETSQAAGATSTVINRSVITDLVSLTGLANGVSAYGALIDLGANFDTCIVTVSKLQGANQADLLKLVQSPDNVNWYLCPHAGYTQGSTHTQINTTASNVHVCGRPGMRYLRSQLDCIGSSQPAGGILYLAVHKGV